MAKLTAKKIWVLVRIQRGFVSEVRGYMRKASALRQERIWRRFNNPDYDDTALSAMVLNGPTIKSTVIS